MQERDEIGSMKGFHFFEHPPVTHECREYEEQCDHASCALCQTLTRKGLHHGHGDLKDDPDVQEAVRMLFMELIECDFESFRCPFPENEPCHQLKRRPRPPSSL
jgi:hypothetical protein